MSYLINTNVVDLDYLMAENQFTDSLGNPSGLEPIFRPHPPVYNVPPQDDYREAIEAAQYLLDIKPSNSKHISGLPAPIPRTPPAGKQNSSDDLIMYETWGDFAANFNPLPSVNMTLDEKVNNWLLSLPFFYIGKNMWIDQGFPGSVYEEDSLGDFGCGDDLDVIEFQARMITRMVVESYTEEKAPDEMSDPYIVEDINGQEFLGYEEHVSEYEIY